MAQTHHQTPQPIQSASKAPNYGRGMSNNFAGNKSPIINPNLQNQSTISSPGRPPAPLKNIGPPQVVSKNLPTNPNSRSLPIQHNSAASVPIDPRQGAQQQVQPRPPLRQTQIGSMHDDRQSSNIRKPDMRSTGGQHPPLPVARVPSAGPGAEFSAMDITESQLEALDRMEADALKERSKTPQTPGGSHVQQPAPSSTGSRQIPHSADGHGLPQPRQHPITPQKLPQSPPRPTASALPPQLPSLPQPKESGPQPGGSSTTTTPSKQNQEVSLLAAAREREKKLQADLDTTRKAVDVIRRDHANAENENRNKMNEIISRMKQLEQENSRLRTQMDFLSVDSSNAAASNVGTASANQPSATTKSKPVLSVGGVELEMPRKNTQQQPTANAGSKGQGKKPSDKPSSNQSIASGKPQQQQLQMAQAATSISDPDKSPDRSPERLPTKKRKRTSELDQSIGDDSFEEDAQVAVDAMDIDSQQLNEDSPQPESEEKYRKQFKQLKQGFRLLQKVFQPSSASSTCKRADNSVGDSFSAQQLRSDIMSDVSTVVDAKLSTFQSNLLESLSKRRKVSEDSTGDSTDSEAQLVSVQNLLKETACQRDVMAKKLEQAESEIQRLRAQRDAQSERFVAIQQENQQLLQRYEQIDLQCKMRQHEFEREREQTHSMLAEKDFRISDLQGLVANLVALLEAKHASFASQIAASEVTANASQKQLHRNILAEENALQPIATVEGHSQIEVAVEEPSANT